MSAGRLSEATTVSSLESTTFSTVFPFLVSIYSTPLAEQYNGPTSVLETCAVPLWNWKSLCFCQSDTNISPLGEMARWGANPKLLDSPASVRTHVEGSPGFQLRMRRSMVRAANSVSWCQHKEGVGKGSTSRPASVLAPKNGDQCFKQRLFDWKVPGLWVLPRPRRPELLFEVHRCSGQRKELHGQGKSHCQPKGIEFARVAAACRETHVCPRRPWSK